MSGPRPGTKYKVIKRPNMVQFKLYVDARMKEMLRHRAEENGVSINVLAAAFLSHAIVGKPRVRVKARSMPYNTKVERVELGKKKWVEC